MVFTEQVRRSKFSKIVIFGIHKLCVLGFLIQEKNSEISSHSGVRPPGNLARENDFQQRVITTLHCLRHLLVCSPGFGWREKIKESEIKALGFQSLIDALAKRNHSDNNGGDRPTQLLSMFVSQLRVWLERVCLLRICPFCTKQSGDLEIFR